MGTLEPQGPSSRGWGRAENGQIAPAQPRCSALVWTGPDTAQERPALGHGTAPRKSPGFSLEGTTMEKLAFLGPAVTRALTLNFPASLKFTSSLFSPAARRGALILGSANKAMVLSASWAK